MIQNRYSLFKISLAFVASALFIGGLYQKSTQNNSTKQVTKKENNKINASSQALPSVKERKVGSRMAHNESSQAVSFATHPPAPAEKIKDADKKPAKIAPKINPYQVLIENISNEIAFKVEDSRTLEKRVIKMSGETLFLKVKSDFAYLLDSEIAKAAFKNYFSNYYQKNKALTGIQKEVSIDLNDLENFVRFSSLREAFLFYQEREQLEGSF